MSGITDQARAHAAQGGASDAFCPDSSVRSVSHPRIRFGLLPLAATALLSGCVTMQPHAPAPTPAVAPNDLQAMQKFRLTEDFLNKMEAFATDELGRLPCDIPMLLFKPSKTQMLSKAAAVFDAQPGVHAALTRHGLTARQLFLGTSTLRSAAFDANLKHWNISLDRDEYFPVNPKNMAFYYLHKQALSRYSR